MSRIQDLIDLKANHECDTEGGTCIFCEQLNAQIYAEQKLNGSNN